MDGKELAFLEESAEDFIQGYEKVLIKRYLDFFFGAPVISGRAGREYFHCQIRRAVDAVLLDEFINSSKMNQLSTRILKTVKVKKASKTVKKSRTVKK